MVLTELMIECFDALSPAGMDLSERHDHLKYVHEAIVDTATPKDAKDALLLTKEAFLRQENADPMSLAINPIEEATEAMKLISVWLGSVGATRYVFHGTVFKRLSQILTKGLMGGEATVWDDKLVPGINSFSAVYFDSTWRGALDWAEIAHSKTRGKRDSISRMPVVIRIPVDEHLSLEPDPFAGKAGCYIVKGNVPVDDAQAIVGRVEGFPKWQPLQSVLASG